MQFIKTKAIEILTNGSLNFTVPGLVRPGQIILYKKDHKSLAFAQKIKNISKSEISNHSYKTHYKF